MDLTPQRLKYPAAWTPGGEGGCSFASLYHPVIARAGCDCGVGMGESCNLLERQLLSPENNFPKKGAAVSH